MAISNAWRFGLPGSTYIDLPEPQIGGLQVAYLEVGGAARSAGGTYLKDRTGAVKRQWTMTLDPYTNATSWQPLEYLYTTQTGPFELYDPTVPNLLDLDARLGADWVTAAGVAITVNSNMRMALSASPASAQTAITTAPAVGTLFALSASTTYTAAITVESASSFTGTFGVYGYTATPSGAGTLLGSTTALTTNGRYTVTFGTSTTPYVELRAVRTAGTANICDPTLWSGSTEAGKGIRSVFIEQFAQDPQSLNGNLSNLTMTLVEQ